MSNSPNQLTGQAQIFLDGALYESAPGAKLKNYEGVTRTEVMSASGVSGYTEKATAPTVDCDLIHGGALRMAALKGFVNGTLTFKCDSGLTYVVRNAWYKGGGQLTADKATLSATFVGKSCEEVTG